MDSTRLPSRLSRRTAAFSLIEFLILLAILGLIAGVVVVSGRRVLAGQDEKAALTSVRQSVWEGATAAASRGVDTVLVRTATGLAVREVGGTTDLRTFALPASVTTNLPAASGASGTVVLRFTPPGRVDLATLQALPSPLTLTVNGHTYKLQVSIIGEVKATS